MLICVLLGCNVFLLTCKDPLRTVRLLLQASHMPMYKTKLCQKFMQTGQCNRGDECSFAHGYNELRQPPPGAPRGPGGPAQDMPGMGPGPGPGPMGMNPVSRHNSPANLTLGDRACKEWHD